MNRLEGKVAIITGGNSGVGKATAIRFAKEGAKVVLVARRENKLHEVEEIITADNGTALVVPADISVPANAKRVTASCMEPYGKIDILINCAGVNVPYMTSIDKCVEDEELDRMLDTNTKGTFYMIRESLAYMIPVQYGAIVNMASTSGSHGYGDGRYVASKGAVISITKHTAMMEAGHNIRCNCLCPATIVTPMVAANLRGEGMDMETLNIMQKHSYYEAPVNMPEDIATTLLFLASDESKNITGQAIVCDFGYSL